MTAFSSNDPVGRLLCWTAVGAPPLIWPICSGSPAQPCTGQSNESEYSGLEISVPASRIGS